MQVDLLGSERSRPLWLTRERDVVAHLFFAAAEIGTVEVEAGEHALTCTLSFPDVEQRQFSVFVQHGNEDLATAPDPGTTVRLRYHRGDSTYSFLTALVDSSEPQRWRLAFPSTIERNERRIVRRYRVLAGGGFRVRLHSDAGTEVLPLFDLSTAGLGIVFDPYRTDLPLGASFAATIVLPGGSTVPALLEVINLRELPGGQGELVAGCHFVGLSAPDLATLARAVSDFSRRPR